MVVRIFDPKMKSMQRARFFLSCITSGPINEIVHVMESCQQFSKLPSKQSYFASFLFIFMRTLNFSSHATGLFQATIKWIICFRFLKDPVTDAHWWSLRNVFFKTNHSHFLNFTHKWKSYVKVCAKYVEAEQFWIIEYLKFYFSQKNIVTGTVIAREFKRSQHLSYDVELHHDNMVYIPSIGRINPTSIIQSNQSFYPLTTSVLILRVLEQESKEKLSIYFDSNKLQYPLALLPGALIKITNVNKVTSMRGSVYYKANLSSTLEILTYSPSTFESLRDLIHQKEEEADVEMEKTMVISCYQNTNLNLNHRSNGVFLIIGRISLVHSVHGKWKCLECFKHVTENVCSPGCRGRRIFALELR